MGVGKTYIPNVWRTAGQSEYGKREGQPPFKKTGDALVALILESATTLVLGHFNPHIITPPWLVKNKLCQDGEVTLRIMPMPQTQGGAFQFKDVQWQIDFQSLLIASSKENCGALAAKVLSKLPHTPVRAVGNNFHYAGTMDEWRESPVPMLGTAGWDDLASVGKVDQLRWVGVFFQDKVRMEVTLAQSETGFAVMFNFHRDTKQAKEAQTAAGRFEEDRDSSKKLIKKLFNQGITS